MCSRMQIARLGPRNEDSKPPPALPTQLLPALLPISEQRPAKG